MDNQKVTPQTSVRHLDMNFVMDIVTEGFGYRETHCPSCKRKLMEVSQVGTVALIEDHTLYLLCKKCLNNTNELHTRRNNGRVMRNYKKYAFLCQEDMTIIGWHLLKQAFNLVTDEVIPYA